MYKFQIFGFSALNSVVNNVLPHLILLLHHYLCIAAYVICSLICLYSSESLILVLCSVCASKYSMNNVTQWGSLPILHTIFHSTVNDCVSIHSAFAHANRNKYDIMNQCIFCNQLLFERVKKSNFFELQWERRRETQSFQMKWSVRIIGISKIKYFFLHLHHSYVNSRVQFTSY